MEAAVVMAISELAKIGLQVYVSYMRQAGLNDEQINTVFDQARVRMLDRDPNKIPEA